jgi:hypothetical protein
MSNIQAPDTRTKEFTKDETDSLLGESRVSVGNQSVHQFLFKTMHKEHEA